VHQSTSGIVLRSGVVKSSVRLLCLAVALGLVATLGAACGSGDKAAEATATRLTTDQAQALAVMRFRTWSRKPATFKVAVTSNVAFSATVAIDFSRGAGYGNYRTTRPGSATTLDEGVIAWSGSYIETTHTGTASALPDVSAWAERPVDTSNLIDLTLLLASNLGADRPENPALLQQGGARLLRTIGTGDGKVWEIRGPGSSAADTAGSTQATSKTTYQVTPAGELKRFAADLGTEEPATVVAVSAPELPATLPPAIATYLRLDAAQ
jgi:hypothetical protein